MAGVGFISVIWLLLLTLSIVNGDIVSTVKPETKVKIFELKTKNMHAKFTNWGATLMSFYIPDKDGKMADVVLGYDNVDYYKNDTVYFGASVGRVANRIGDAKFKLNGETYNLVANDGNNSLHGGKPGYSDVIWNIHKHVNGGHNPHITFSYVSEDGEQGYPGKLKVQITYKLHSKKNAMTIQMKAKSVNKPSPVNLAHHTYWNLGGHNSGDVLSHNIQILGSHITPTDDALIPNGEIKPVNGTPFDFLESRPVGSRLSEVPKGYDINYCLDLDHPKHKDNKHHKHKKLAVILEDPKSGRKMELRTDQPGLQFYTGGMLKNVKGKQGAVYKAHAGIAMETQGYPDAVNHPNFPSQIVQPGDTYSHLMVFKFSVKGEKASS